tara:strand:+ start:106 stop:1119 length:1014 start_codon:yes stop_codon:yes gene_type:complete
MTNQENKIPIKGYATFDPLKHCWIGSGFRTEWFSDLPIYKNKKIMDPLKRIAEETEEDYQTLDKILKDAGVKTYRSFLDIDKVGSLKNIYRPPVCPRDHFAVIGNKLYAVSGGSSGYASVLKQIARENLEIVLTPGVFSTANICRVGKDLWWDIHRNSPSHIVEQYTKKWTQEGYRVHTSNRGYHTDATFCVVKPGCIVSLKEIQDYEKEFPGWDILYLPDQSWDKVHPFLKIKEKVGGRWWLNGEEHNDQLIEFVDTWLNDWVGFVEETVFDVNMLSIDQNTIICNNYNKEVFEHFKKHKVEPIIFNFRHRYFWDGGVHCITQDLYREGTQEDYFG